MKENINLNTLPENIREQKKRGRKPGVYGKYTNGIINFLSQGDVVDSLAIKQIYYYLFKKEIDNVVASGIIGFLYKKGHLERTHVRGKYLAL